MEEGEEVGEGRGVGEWVGVGWGGRKKVGWGGVVCGEEVWEGGMGEGRVRLLKGRW